MNTVRFSRTRAEQELEGMYMRGMVTYEEYCVQMTVIHLSFFYGDMPN